MSAPEFWDLFERGGLYLVRGEMAILRGYWEAMDLALFDDEDGNALQCGSGLIRNIT